MRTPSSTTRVRMTFLVSERMALESSRSRPANSAPTAAMISALAASLAALR
jgi:hypothetical protein